MKQLLIAALSLAGLLVPGFAFAGYDCYLICSPARVYCQPSGAPMPPIYKLCGVGSGAPAPDSLAASLDTTQSAQSPPPACSAQQVFDEDTQTYEWQMVCD